MSLTVHEHWCLASRHHDRECVCGGGIDSEAVLKALRDAAYSEAPDHLSRRLLEAVSLIEGLSECAKDRHDYRDASGLPETDAFANYRVCATCGTDGSFDR